ncbi:DarT ssDNA thymidine ADP-ribosyltransferase family protein [Zeaxanthinibacter enoshimensis]|uniref:Uncharacterized protein DUF4433 n=1 Tax=Zeaxanthinibacter enoshimensis TaxID=392009 RepID=A0A4V3D487_9FLAO|nr:DarT ssDNA thymidine ADP-ribosyltransferase family protein [Zeaxanthinibacter enoshimensis]TDQ33381.1 uncharacterized protein DUF4433 [Zeaxanthinibacter enoshimensis]
MEIVDRICHKGLVKLGLKNYKLKYRKTEALTKYEQAIIGLLHEQGGLMEWKELGEILGFAVAENLDEGVRKDYAEVGIFESYLDALQKVHLISRDEDCILLSEWGEVAVQEGVKHLFYNGLIRVPGFMELQQPDPPIIVSFAELGLELQLEEVKEFESPWPIASRMEAVDDDDVNRLINMGFHFQKNIFIDVIEESNGALRKDVDINFEMDGKLLKCYFEDHFIASLTDLFNYEGNEELAKEVKLQLGLKAYLENNKAYRLDELLIYESIINWDVFFETYDEEFDWKATTLRKLGELGVSSKLISQHSPEDVLYEQLEESVNVVDWPIITGRLSLDFILTHLPELYWDATVLAERITVEVFKDYYLELKALSDFPFTQYYRQLDKEFLSEQFDHLPDITAYITRYKPNWLAEFLALYPNGPWNWTQIGQNMPLEDLFSLSEEHKVHFPSILVLQQIITEELHISGDEFGALINRIPKADNNPLLNRQHPSNMNLAELKLLDGKNLIFWGDSTVPGYEMNTHQEWNYEIIDYFQDKWNYPEAIQFLEEHLQDVEVIRTIPLNWNYSGISKNAYLVSEKQVLETYGAKLDPNEVIQVWSPKDWKRHLPWALSRFDDIYKEHWVESASSTISIEDVLCHQKEWIEEINEAVEWDLIVFNTKISFLHEQMWEIYEVLLELGVYERVKTPLTSKLNVEFQLENCDFDWDWKVVTENALIKDILNEESLYEFAHLWYWNVILENYYTEEDLLKAHKLPEIATLIAQSENEEFIDKAWRYITENYPKHLLWEDIGKTIAMQDIFRWDWNLISSTNRISLDKNTLSHYRNNINWDLLSENEVINKLFYKDTELFDGTNDWIEYVLGYLIEFKQYWNFQGLSKVSNITWNETIIQKFKDHWDWQILSSSASNFLTTKKGNKVKYNTKIFSKYIDQIDFNVISQRDDIQFDLEFVKKYDNKSWNWNELSGNPAVKLDKKVLLGDLKNKPWNWFSLSQHPDLEFDNTDLLEMHDRDLDWGYFSSQNWINAETVCALETKPWDWHQLSVNRNLHLSTNLLRIFATNHADEVSWEAVLKNVNLDLNDENLMLLSAIIEDNSHCWGILSSHPKLDFSNLKADHLLKYSSYWNWEVLLENWKLDFNDVDNLKRYVSFIDWGELSRHHKFSPTFEILEAFKNLLDWRFLSPKVLNDVYKIERFSQYVNWEVISEKMDFDGKLPFVKRHIAKFHLSRLQNNPTVPPEMARFIKEYLRANIEIRFVEKLKEQGGPWAGNVYHFTHLTNALAIIKNRKILSRNKASGGGFSDAAGSVVKRRDEAHNYARFYFRPQTPTQFYNECLGKDFQTNSFEKAKDLDLPKCPIPVFFKFDLQEILSQIKDKCFISDGNLQTNWAKMGTIQKMILHFDFEDVYSTIEHTSDDNWKTYLNKSQQEFLVRDEFNFSNLTNYEILVKTQGDLQQLKQLLRNDHEILSKLRVANGRDKIFNNQNREIYYTINENKLQVDTDYLGDGKVKGNFVIDLSNSRYKVRGGTVTNRLGNRITFYPDIEIEFKSELCFSVSFSDELTNKEPWEVIKYCNVH